MGRGRGELKKQCTNLSPVNGIMTCAWEENTINDNLILGLLKGEREEKKQQFRQMKCTHAQHSIHVFIYYYCLYPLTSKEQL